MAEVSGYSLLAVSEIRICNTVFRKILREFFQRVFAMKLIAKSLGMRAVSGGALMAGQMRMSLNTVPVTDNPTIGMVI